MTMPPVLIEGDCLDVLRTFDDGQFDSIVCDPPYGLEFMGKDWDSFKTGGKQPKIGDPDGSPHRRNTGTPSWAASGNPRCSNCGGTKYDRTRPNGCACDSPRFPNEAANHMRAFQGWCEEWAVECLRVLKPGGHLVAFGGTRTYHRLTAGIEDAGFEIRDGLQWLYGSGFPKSLDVSKAIDATLVHGKSNSAGLKAANASRPGEGRERASTMNNGITGADHSTPKVTRDEPETEDAARWQGWGTALKPAHEPIVLARKPLGGTVAANVQAYGTGALNIDGTRTAMTPDDAAAINAKHAGMDVAGYERAAGSSLNLSTNPIPLRAAKAHDEGRWPSNVLLSESAAVELGGHARFFYCAKAPARERPKIDGVAHPTVKPLALMAWLVRLVTPPGGIVLDPFAGSGTTLEAARNEGFWAFGIEREASYIPLIMARLGGEAA